MDKSNLTYVFREYLAKNVAEQYPISNRELLESTDYIKNNYLKMLAVILLQSEVVSNAQLEILKRIIAGAETEKNVEDFLRMALEIKIKDYIRFSDEFKDLQLKYRWILDAIILICVHEKTQEQLMLLAYFCEFYKVSKDELKYIATMARAIVCMKAEDYVTAYEIREDSILNTIFSDYMYLISKNCICHNEHMTIFQPFHKEDVTVQILDKIQEINTSCIKIIGAVIELDNCKWNFSNKEKVILEGCHLTGGNRNPLCFELCEEIVIRNCIFEHFKTKTIILNEVDKALVQSCQFIDCNYTYEDYSWRPWCNKGCVITSEKPLSIGRFDLMNTSFIDCGGVNTGNNYGTAFISNINSSVNNCSFTNCWHFHKRNEIDPEDEQRTMFTSDSSATNCRYNNSALFN